MGVVCVCAVENTRPGKNNERARDKKPSSLSITRPLGAKVHEPPCVFFCQEHDVEAPTVRKLDLDITSSLQMSSSGTDTYRGETKKEGGSIDVSDHLRLRWDNTTRNLKTALELNRGWTKKYGVGEK